MSRPTTECPFTASGQASAFGSGDLTDAAEYARVARHLHGCAECRVVARRDHHLTKLLAEYAAEPSPPSAVHLDFEALRRRVLEQP